MMHQLVTIITPTTHERREFNGCIIKMVEAQDYPNIEHIMDFEVGSVGAKRQRMCESAKGEIIVHFDSDDHYAPDWVSKSISALLASGADIVGLAAANFYDVDSKETYQYTYPPNDNIHGATMCYFKDLAIKNPFSKLMEGEDSQFCRGKKTFSHGYINGFTATIHGGNTSKKNVTGDRWVKVIPSP